MDDPWYICVIAVLLVGLITFGFCYMLYVQDKRYRYLYRRLSTRTRIYYGLRVYLMIPLIVIWIGMIVKAFTQKDSPVKFGAYRDLNYLTWETFTWATVVVNFVLCVRNIFALWKNPENLNDLRGKITSTIIHLVWLTLYTFVCIFALYK